MNKRIMLTIGIGLTVLLLAALFTTAVFAQGPGGAFGGMMGGAGTMGSRGQSGFGGMMGGQYGCPGASGAWGVPGNTQPITFDKAVEAAHQYLKSYNDADPSAGSGQALALAEVMEFDNNFYALVTEKGAETGAFELLVNRYTGAVHPEPGPNMMWNTKYGHMASGGMMGGRWNQQTGAMTVTVAQARTTAQQWLDANQPGAKLADDEMRFPGYFTMDFLKDGKVAGMLSVNGYTGQVWHHAWHGNFIGEKEF